MTARIIYDMSAEAYHANPGDVPLLSSSIAHVLVSRSPLHAWAQHPKLGGYRQPPKKSYDNGNLSHALLLDSGKTLEIIDADSYRTKAAQEARDAARAEGKVPVLKHEWEAAAQVAITLKKRFAEYGIKLTGAREVVVLWEETADDGTVVQCKGMMDHLDLPQIDDLKSCRSAHPHACQRHIDGYGYAIQQAAYTSAAEQLRPDLAGRIAFRFVFFELDEPHAVTPVRLSGEFRELGRRRWRRAVNLWAKCMRENRWPGYVEGLLDIDPPPWALAQELERQMDDHSTFTREALAPVNGPQQETADYDQIF